MRARAAAAVVLVPVALGGDDCRLAYAGLLASCFASACKEGDDASEEAELYWSGWLGGFRLAAIGPITAMAATSAATAAGLLTVLSHFTY